MYIAALLNYFTSVALLLLPSSKVNIQVINKLIIN